jgi:hypothetical protein
MKKFFTAVLLCSAALASTSWAQSASEPSAPAAPAAAGNSDEIVKMRMQIAAANREYNKKVAAAKKVYDAHKAAAAKVRDHQIEAARSGTAQ